MIDRMRVVPPLAVAVCVVIAATWLVTSRGTGTRVAPSPSATAARPASSGSSSPGIASATVPATLDIAALPPGYPTPSLLETEAEAIAYAKAVYRDKGPWLEEHAARTRKGYVERWKRGNPVTEPLPTLGPEDKGYAWTFDVVWLVGLHSETEISRDRVVGTPYMADVWDSGEELGRFGGHCVYVGFDDLGNLYTYGLLDLPDETGTPQPQPGLPLSSIEALPKP